MHSILVRSGPSPQLPGRLFLNLSHAFEYRWHQPVVSYRAVDVRHRRSLRVDEVRSDVILFSPVLEYLTDLFRTIVTAYVLGFAMPFNHLIQRNY